MILKTVNSFILFIAYWGQISQILNIGLSVVDYAQNLLPKHLTEIGVVGYP